MRARTPMQNRRTRDAKDSGREGIGRGREGLGMRRDWAWNVEKGKGYGVFMGVAFR